MADIHVIIVASGSGSRFGADTPKQYCPIGADRRPVLMHTIDAFRRALPEAHITLVVNAAHRPLWQSLCRNHGFTPPADVDGGPTRWHSVANALKAIAPAIGPDTIVMVHDGARPLAPAAMIRRVAAVVTDGGAQGCIPAVAVTDSLRMIDPSTGQSRPVDRSLMRAVQTPQAFRGPLLIDAYRLPYSTGFTDDASVMAAAGYGDIRLAEGSERNIKITHPHDLAIAELLLRDE